MGGGSYDLKSPNILVFQIPTPLQVRGEPPGHGGASRSGGNLQIKGRGGGGFRSVGNFARALSFWGHCCCRSAHGDDQVCVHPAMLSQTQATQHLAPTGEGVGGGGGGVEGRVYVKIADLGISRRLTPGGVMGFKGSPGFMAPEILKYVGTEACTEKVSGCHGNVGGVRHL